MKQEQTEVKKLSQEVSTLLRDPDESNAGFSASGSAQTWLESEDSAFDEEVDVKKKGLAQLVRSRLRTMFQR